MQDDDGRRVADGAVSGTAARCSYDMHACTTTSTGGGMPRTGVDIARSTNGALDMANEAGIYMSLNAISTFYSPAPMRAILRSLPRVLAAFEWPREPLLAPPRPRPPPLL